MRHNAIVLCGVILLLGSELCALAQQSKPTVRHHRVAEPSEQTANPDIDQAEAAMQRNDFASAEALLHKAVTANPSDYRAWFDLGYVYNSLQRPADAIDAYRKAVAAKPDVFESNLNLGLLLAKEGQNAEAAKYLKTATELKPSSPQSLARAWLGLGRVQETIDPQQALAAFGEAEKLDAKDAEPHFSAALLLQKRGDLDAAAREYQSAAELNPASTDGVSGLASVYVAQKKFPEAEAALRKVIAADPQNNTARVHLARVLAAEGKNDDAAQQLQRSDPGDPQAALSLGTLYAKAGKDAEAEQQFRIAVQKLPQDAAAHYALGSQLMHEKKYPEAQRELMAAVQLKPDLAEAYGNLAVVAAENQQYELTLRALDDRAKYLPEIPATLFLRATTHDHLKAIPKAVEYYQRFLEADEGKFPDQEWQARHRLIALDPQHADKYRVKTK